MFKIIKYKMVRKSTASIENFECEKLELETYIQKLYSLKQK